MADSVASAIVFATTESASTILVLGIPILLATPGVTTVLPVAANSSLAIFTGSTSLTVLSAISGNLAFGAIRFLAPLTPAFTVPGPIKVVGSAKTSSKKDATPLPQVSLARRSLCTGSLILLSHVVLTSEKVF